MTHSEKVILTEFEQVNWPNRKMSHQEPWFIYFCQRHLMNFRILVNQGPGQGSMDSIGWSICWTLTVITGTVVDFYSDPNWNDMVRFLGVSAPADSKQAWSISHWAWYGMEDVWSVRVALKLKPHFYTVAEAFIQIYPGIKKIPEMENVFSITVKFEHWTFCASRKTFQSLD